jgi:aspartyl-tRNA(Asn)/glutamyl-tRNA(Gln) amidotransferase subunit C
MPGTGTQDTGGIDVAYVARLARLHLTEEEVRTFGGQLKDIVAYMRKIGQLDLRGIEPTSHTHPLQNVFRRDEIRPGLDRDAVLANAPAHAGEQFIVPKIVE